MYSQDFAGGVNFYCVRQALKLLSFYLPHDAFIHNLTYSLGAWTQKVLVSRNKFGSKFPDVQKSFH